mmetsp:Transcript_28172/g.71467  ORF Transcript_28172/g.71467 Transcript_28172/m.71467 type:complete len:244 (+) Transcript_28172:474-1205(+)
MGDRSRDEGPRYRGEDCRARGSRENYPPNLPSRSEGAAGCREARVTRGEDEDGDDEAVHAGGSVFAREVEVGGSFRRAGGFGPPLRGGHAHVFRRGHLAATGRAASAGPDHPGKGERRRGPFTKKASPGRARWSSGEQPAIDPDKRVPHGVGIGDRKSGGEVARRLAGPARPELSDPLQGVRRPESREGPARYHRQSATKGEPQTGERETHGGRGGVPPSAGAAGYGGCDRRGEKANRRPLRG